MYINRERLEYRSTCTQSLALSSSTPTLLSPTLFCSSLPSPLAFPPSTPSLFPSSYLSSITCSLLLSFSLFLTVFFYSPFSLLRQALFSLRFLRSYSIPSNRNQTSWRGGSERRMRQDSNIYMCIYIYIYIYVCI